MLYQLSADEIAERLLAQQKPAQILAKSDQQLIQWHKKDALRKMPIEIRPKQQLKVEKIEKMKGTFTSMIGFVKEKAYKYEKNDADAISKIFLSYASDLRQKTQQAGKQRGQQFELHEEKGEKMIPGMMGGLNQSHNMRSQSHERPDYLMGNMKKSFAPFVSNSQNPYDRHANSKLVRNNRVVFDGKMRNIAALIEKNKKTNHFKTQGTFGRASSQAKRNQVMDVTDILKYTLGEKRERQTGYRPEPIKNPFVRVPAKYSQSLNDFYVQN